MAEQAPSFAIKGFIPRGDPKKGSGDYWSIGASPEGSKFRLMIDAKVSNLSDITSLISTLLDGYLKLAGRTGTGGQTAYGGDAAAGMLTLYGNSIDADTGLVRIGNLRLLGTRVPTTLGDIALPSGLLKFYDGTAVRRIVTANDSAPTTDNVLVWTGTVWAPSFLGVASGGTGQISLTAGALLTGAGASAIAPVGPGSTGQVAISDGSVFNMRTVGTDATITSAGALTIANDAVTNAKLADMAAVTVKVNATNGAANPTDLALTSGHSVFNTGTALASRYYSQWQTKTGTSYTTTAADNGTLFDMDCTSGSCTITLASAVTMGAGYTVGFKRKTASNTCTVATTSSQTIDGYVGTLLIADNSQIWVTSNGATWDLTYCNDYMIAHQSAYVDAPTNNTFVNITSLSVPSGVWDLTGFLYGHLNGATMTECLFAISVNSANTVTDHVLNMNLTDGLPPASSYDSRMTIPSYRLALTSTTTVYLKFAAIKSAGTPQSQGRLTAVRVG